MKKLMLGNEALARGLFEAGCRVVSSYPGTPSTEITEYAAKYDEIYCEWAPNEKVAMEVALGASVGGARAFCAQKHVGLNVAADPLFTASYTGVNGGLVVVVADDQGMHSSQNEQDSRHYAIAAKLPMLEPADSAECKDYIARAFELSEVFDTPVLIRTCTRIAHSRSAVSLGERVEIPLKEYKKDMGKYVMMPAPARARHIVVEKRMKLLEQFADSDSINKIIKGDKKIGIIAAGIAYQYAREALGDNASYLKLGMVNPLPMDMIKEFSKGVDKLYCIEELDGVIENQIKAAGIEVSGKELFGNLGEYTPDRIKEELLGIKSETVSTIPSVVARPPVLCPGCPHRGLFYTLNKLKLTVFGDIGCYTLGSLAPLSAMDTCICMGASVGMAHGFSKAQGADAAKNTVAVIGDSTFIHSGITGLIDMVYNKGNSTLIILDNSITGMTGHQNNPATGYTIKNEPTIAVDIDKLCEAVGVKRIRVVDPFDLEGCEAAIKEETATSEPSVIIVRRPCALLKTVKRKPAVVVDPDKCKGCKLCMKIGCPAISMIDGKAVVDKTLCTGCELCIKLCKFDAMKTEA